MELSLVNLLVVFTDTAVSEWCAPSSVSIGYRMCKLSVILCITVLVNRLCVGGGGGDWRRSLNYCGLWVLFITVSNSMFDLNCNWSLSMLLGCVLLCLYISNFSVVFKTV